MKNQLESEDEQWIPWEISYSLKEKTRENRSSFTNAMLAVVLPDEYGSYQYLIEQSPCPHCKTETWKTETLFNILKENMFNRKQPKRSRCVDGICGSNFHINNDHSYIHPVRWDHFISNIDNHIDLATRNNENIHHYNIRKTA